MTSRDRRCGRQRGLPSRPEFRREGSRHERNDQKIQMYLAALRICCNTCYYSGDAVKADEQQKKLPCTSLKSSKARLLIDLAADAMYLGAPRRTAPVRSPLRSRPSSTSRPRGTGCDLLRIEELKRNSTRILGAIRATRKRVRKAGDLHSHRDLPGLCRSSRAHERAIVYGQACSSEAVRSGAHGFETALGPRPEKLIALRYRATSRSS